VASSVKLAGLSHMWQTWNNCGPATLAMNLSYYGSTLSQADVGAALRLYEDDKNVGPEEMAVFARSQGFNALVRVNGDADRLRLLLSNSVPVLLETWHEPEPNNGMGHYRLLVGYEDATREWIAYDSYDSRGLDPNQPYTGIRVPYDELDRLWSVFNRTYVLIYTDELAPDVEGILGEELDDATMWQRALQHAWAETRERPDDPFAWFNLGSDLIALGQFEPAATAYDHARQIGLPWRMLWYQFGPFQAYYETARYQEVVALTDATIQTTSSVEEIYYWKGMALKAQGDVAGARQAWQRALELNPNYAEAAAVLAGLEPQP
jgi:tetratricopeptide (TPR) repeat protein